MFCESSISHGAFAWIVASGDSMSRKAKLRNIPRSFVSPKPHYPGTPAELDITDLRMK
jgi:hypothetical protein